MKKKLFKILAVASMLITSFPAVPVFASEPTPKTVQVGPEETYTSLKELFDGMVDEGPTALTVQLTGDTTIDGNLEVPRNKGIDYLHLTGNGHSVNVTAASGSALFANGAELTIGDRVTFNKNITIYGGGNNAAVAGDTNISVYQSVINGTIYAGSLKGSVGGTTSINISDSDIQTVVFGSNGAANELSRSSISSSTIENMYLGNINANTPGMPEHLISGTTVTNAYLAKNGTVSGDVNFYVSPASSTINNFAKGEGVTATGKQTIHAGIGEEDGMTLTVKNVSLGNADSGKFAINVSQKNTFKLGGSKASHLDSLTLENGAKLYLNDSYTISNLTTNNGVIYLPESGTLTINGELEGNAKVNFSKTYQEGDVVVATPANDSSDKVYSNVTGVSLIKSANATNTTWVYSQDAIVTVNAGEGGTVSENSLYVTKGNDCNISFTPNEGYVVDTVKVDGVENTDIISGQTVTLSNVQADTVVDIMFKEIDLTVVKEMVDALPTQYSGEADRNAILNTKILYEDFGGDYSFGATYAQKMKDALLLLPQIEFASSSKHATVTNPESILHTFTKSDAEAILNGTYSKIVFGLYEAEVSEVGYQTILGAALGGEMSRNFHLKFGKRYVDANGSTKKFKDVDLTKQNTVNVSITPTSAETTPASGYNERRVRVYYTEDTWTEENPVEYFVYFMEDTTPNTKEYTIQPNKLGAYVVTYWDVNSPSKDHILVVFRTTVGKWSDETGFLPKLMFLEKDANGNATLSKDMIPTTMTAPLGGVYSETEGYWTPSINTSVGAIKGDTEFVWTFEINLADYSRINELIEKASVYTAENAYNYDDLKASIDAVKWGLNILKQKEVDAMADKIQVELNATRFKEADYTAVDKAISDGQTPILSGWVIDTTEYDKAVAAVDRTKNITQQAEVDAMAKAINDAVAGFEYKPGDYGRVNNAVARANTYDETLYENWKDVETALNAIVYGLKINEQDRINDMAWEVEKALDALNPKKADYSEVQEIVDAFDYTLYKNPAVFQEIAFAINWDYRITEQHLVDAYVEQLNNAKAQLVLRDADYSAVNQAISDFNYLYADNEFCEPETVQAVRDAIDAVVYGKTILEQAEVDAMAKAIRDAMSNVKYQQANYSEVERQIAIANSLNKDLYTNWSFVEAAISDVIWGKDASEQALVDQMAYNIELAISSLEYKPADYTEIYKALERIENYESTDFEDFSEVQMWIDAINWNYRLDMQHEVDYLAEELNNAIDNLKLLPADYSEVQELINRAETYNGDLYANWSDVEAAINAVDWTKGRSEQMAVNEMARKIYDALENLQLKGADYTELQKAVDKFNELDPGLYGDAYYDLKYIVDTIDWNLQANEQDYVDEQTQIILDGIENLTPVLASYTEVNAAIERANAINQEEVVDFSKVEEAINAIIWDLPYEEQATVDAYATNINNAIDSLVYKVFVAQIGTEKYTSLQEAVDNAKANDVIKLIDNITIADLQTSSLVTIAKDDVIIIDLNGFVVDVKSTFASNTNVILNNGTLTIKDTSASKTGKITYKYEGVSCNYGSWGSYLLTNSNGSTFVLESGTLENTTAVSQHIYYAVNNTTYGDAVTTVTINGGKVINKNYTAIRNFENSSTGKIVLTLNGGTVQGTTGIYVQNPSKSVFSKGEVYIKGGEILSTRKEKQAIYVYGTSTANIDGLNIEISGGELDGYIHVYPEEESNQVVKATGLYALQTGITEYDDGTFSYYYTVVYKAADYSAVDAAIEAAKALDATLFQDFSGVTSAIDAVVRGYDIRKQAEVDAMAKAITDALDTLEYKSADYTELNKTIAEANSLNKDLFKNFSAVQTVLDEIETGLDIRYQTTVDSWNQELTTAIQNLQYKSADYTAVDEAIAKANLLNPNLYLDFSKVTEAINAVIRGKNITQQTEVDAMAKAITDAINALEYKPADYTAVDEAIEKANAVNKDLYSNFDKVTEAINAVVRGKNITEQEEVDAMAAAIERAIVLLTYKDADYTAVDNAIARANSLNRDLYKDFSGVINAIEAVQRGKDITEQASVDAMAKAINDAIDALEYKDADYTAVDKAIEKAEVLNKDLYKNYSVVTNAINAVVRGKNITEQASVDAMAKAINDAIDALEYKDADYTAVDKAIDDANELNKDLYKDFTEVTNAINSVVRGKNITEQTEVDAMAKAINDAINALEYKDADYSRVDALIAIVEGLNRSEFEDLSVVDAAVGAVVRGKNITQQTEVDAMAEAIQKALDEACDFADYTEVEKAIETFENLEHNLYTSETLKDVQDAIDAVIWNKASKNQALVDAMAKAINDAIDALEYKDADYTAVDKAIEKSQEFDQNLYINFDEVTDAINAVVRGKDVREQASVDAMAKAINDAIDALEYKDADYTGVREAIARAEALDKNLYKDFSGVTDAINSVNWLKDIRSQDKVDAMAKAINDAIDALEYRDADYSAVEKAIEEANKLNKDLYKNFEIVTNAINAVDYTKDITEQTEVDEMAKAINDAIDALEYRDADYSAVDKAITDAEELNKDLYKNFEVVTNSINAVVRGKNITEQTVVDAMAKAITDAIDALEYKSADYTAVDKAIADANQVNKDLYKNFEIVTNAINAVDRNKNITEQAEVDAMAKAINDAIDALEYKDADYTEVDKAITKANSLDKTLFKDFTKVTEAINAVVRGKDIREQATVDAMAKAINDAINALEYVDADYSKVDAAIAKANTFDKDLYKNFNNVTAAINAVVRGKNISEQAEVDAMAEAINKAIDGLRYNDADYTAVDAAIKNAKTYNLNLYVNGNAVTKAINAVDRNKDFTQQAEVDAMAKAINDAVDALEYKAADYTAVDKAIAKANALDKKLYKDFTKVTAAINAVVRDKDITEQKAVDAMAKAINDAIAKLEYKSFSVKFDANGGTNLSTETITKTYGSSLGELPTVTRNGFKFLGWFTKKDGGTQITTTTKMGSTNPTYYAHWEQKETGVFRIFGSNRYQTAFKVGITLKGVLDADKVDTIIIASGKGFADALAGNYLAAKKNAPIIMTDGKNAKDVQDYIVANVKKGGTIYVLGGTAAVPSNVTKGLKGYTVKRLAGKDRYETNLAILKEAGVNGEDVLISTGKNFADSLSASATGKPILLVDKKLTASQREFLSGLKDSDFYVLGGVNAVSKSIENSIKGYGTVVRLAGDSRYETSVMIAKTFFKTPSYAVVAYGKNYPDGLSGGALAYQMGGPLLLVENKAANTIADYTASAGITSGVVLGGSGLISDSTARKIFKLEVTAEIVVK